MKNLSVSNEGRIVDNYLVLHTYIPKFDCTILHALSFVSAESQLSVFFIALRINSTYHLHRVVTIESSMEFAGP
jgi:hypothetical protein